MSNMSNTTALAAVFAGQVREFERADRSADAALAKIGAEIAKTFRDADLKDRAAAIAALSGRREGRSEGVLFPALKAGLNAAYVHAQDVEKFLDKNTSGETELRCYNFKSKRFQRMDKKSIQQAVSARMAKVRAAMVHRAFGSAKRPEPAPLAVKRCFDLGEMSRKIGDLPSPERGKRNDTVVDAFGGDKNIAAIVDALDAAIALFPKNIQVAAKALRKS